LTISTIKNSLYSEDKIQALYWTQESFEQIESAKGKLARYFKGNTLVINQDYIKDNKLTVANCVKP
jgi:translation elongation factor EF-Ts